MGCMEWGGGPVDRCVRTARDLAAQVRGGAAGAKKKNAFSFYLYLSKYLLAQVQAQAQA